MTVLSDVRYAVRAFRRTPTFTIAAVASLALGIGVNTTMFTVVDALLLSPLSVPRPDAMVRIGRSMNDDDSFRSVAHEEFEFIRRHATSFSDLLGSQIASVLLSGRDGAQFVSAEIVTGNYFRGLEQRLAVGRSFHEDTGADSIVISDRLWRRRFAADAAIVGAEVSINNRTFTVAGIAAPGFTGTFRGVATDVWLRAVRPETVPRTDPRAEQPVGMVIGVLEPGTSIAAAAAELRTLSRRRRELDAGYDRGRGFVLADTRGIHPGIARRVAPFVLALMGMGGVVLLIVCANVGGLLLARGSARRAELALRRSLGASRLRIVTQLLIESVVLAAAGATLGVLSSFWAVRSINALTLVPGPTGTAAFLDLRLDQRVLLFAAAATILATIAAGLIPALQGARVDLVPALKDPGAAPDRRRSWLRASLVTTQVTIAFVLGVGALLLVRSVQNSTRVDLGFDPDGVAVVSIDLKPLGYDRPNADRFFEQLLERTRGLRGVERAAVAGFIPMGGRGATLTVTAPGSAARSGDDRLTVAYNRVSADYFATVRQPLIRGRDFAPQDRRAAPAVAIVNEALAKRLWRSEDAVGKRLRIAGEPGDPGIEREIVGVVQDAKYESFADGRRPFLFLPAHEGFAAAQTLHARAASRSSTLHAEINALARSLDAGVVPLSSGTMREAMAPALVPAQIAQVVVGVSATIALLLATGGLYALVFYTVEQRRREIGIRVALGATRRQVFQLVVGDSARLTAIALGLGLLLAAGTMRILSSLLIGLSPYDPLTFAGAGVLMAAVTFAAGYVAARKGLAIDPAVSLKYE